MLQKHSAKAKISFLTKQEDNSENTRKVSRNLSSDNTKQALLFGSINVAEPGLIGKIQVAAEWGSVTLVTSICTVIHRTPSDAVFTSPALWSWDEKIQ